MRKMALSVLDLGGKKYEDSMSASDIGLQKKKEEE